MSYQPRMSALKEENEDRELRNLLENYLRRSEELEAREGKVLRQIELLQTAVASLQEWNQSRKPSAAPPDSARPDLREIEAETKLIEEETRRIRREIEEKKKANRRLEEELGRRKSLAEPKLVDVRYASPEREGADFFADRLRKLREMERKLKAESDLKSAEARKKQRDLQQKIEALEREANERLGASLRKT